MKRINITCPACGSRAYLRPASVVYGDKAPDPETSCQGFFKQNKTPLRKQRSLTIIIHFFSCLI